MADIVYDHVSFSYPNGFVALEDINLTIHAGTQVAIIGQNGAGKTTAVKMLNGLLTPTSGIVRVGEKNTANYTVAQLSHEDGYVFQNPDDQIFHNSVQEEIGFAPRIMKLSQQQIDERITYSARLCGLQDVLETNPYELPLSTRKFVTMASVIAMDSDVLIFDEPTAGQDKRGMERIAHIIDTLRSANKTVITITHDMEFVCEVFDSVIVMAHKHVLCTGTPTTVFARNDILEEAMLKKPVLYKVAEACGINIAQGKEADIVNMVARHCVATGRPVHSTNGEHDEKRQ